MIEIIYEEHLHFIGEVLKVAVVNAPLGFEKATMVFFKIKVEWTTIIVNDTQMMEVRIYNMFWRWLVRLDNL